MSLMRPTIQYLIVIGSIVALLVVWHILQNPGGERTERLFVYGTLMNPVVRFYACHCVVEEEAATLSSYQKLGRNIVLDETSVVTGTIIHVSSWELESIDRYEKTPIKYVRQRIEIEGRPAWVYTLNQ